MRPDSVVTWLWKPRRGYRSAFDTDKVNVLARMIWRHYAHPIRVICVTDIPKGLDSSIEIFPDWKDFSDLQSPHGGHNPSCYRRLRAFDPEAGKVFGNRFVMLDIDTVIVNDVTPLWDRPEDFVAWGETDPRSWYNGSMMLMTAGARSKVWSTFDSKLSPQSAKQAGRFGSDQGWISHCLGKGEARWTKDDGVYSYNVHLRPNNGELPANARIVMFHGGNDPWSQGPQSLEWVRAAWR